MQVNLSVGVPVEDYHVPEGWKLLEAGTLRRVRVSAQWLADRNDDKPSMCWPICIYSGEDAPLDGCSEFQVLGSSKSVVGAFCGKASVWLETTAPILIKE
jgi:hypothetical protein